MKKRTTIKDIAHTLNLNISTVSRALNNNDLINVDTRNMIIKTAKKMNYCPNQIAKGLIGKNTKVIALITPYLNPHVLPVIRGVTDACKKNGYALMLFSNDYWSDETITFLDIKNQWLVDGMLIYNVVYHKDFDKNIKKIKKEKIPFVFINKFLHHKKVNNVSIDNFKAVYSIVEHLHKLGHNKIGIINGSLRSNDGIERFNAFKKSLKKLNLKYYEKYNGIGEFGSQFAYDAMKKILKYKKKPDAMVCASDLMAISTIQAIKDAGLKVPDDIAVTGFDNIALGKYLRPTLTTVHIPLEKIGSQAAELLQEIIENPGKKVKEIAINTELIIGESTDKGDSVRKSELEKFKAAN